MKALVISPDPAMRETLRLALQGGGQPGGPAWEFVEAVNGVEGIRLAWRDMPDVVVAEEIASRAGGFAVTKDLRDAAEPFPGRIILILARRQDEWLARWAGADAWFVRPVDPFALAERVTELLGSRAGGQPHRTERAG